MSGDNRTDQEWKESMQLEYDLLYWNDLSDEIGWDLTGFSGRYSATFVDSRDKTIQITGGQRDDIMQLVYAE